MHEKEELSLFDLLSAVVEISFKAGFILSIICIITLRMEWSITCIYLKES